MSYAAVLADINDNITANGTGAITGTILNEVLTSILDFSNDEITALQDLLATEVDTLEDTIESEITALEATINGLLAANDVLVYKGSIDCSTNPNYPAGEAGWCYRVSVAGKIGGASGPNVEINDRIECFVDGSVAGDHATVGANWTIIQTNIDGAVTGPVSSVNNAIPIFSGVSGKLIIDSAVLISTDGTLAANSDLKIPTEKAIKTYFDAFLAANNAMVYKGALDCSGNPNYPAADAGHTYRIGVAGKIGGASGTTVEVGDIAMCITDGTAAGDQATVGAQWDVVQVNLNGAVIGPASSVDNRLAQFDGVSGKLLEDSGVAVSIDGTLASNSDAKLPTEKAVKTAIAAERTHMDFAIYMDSGVNWVYTNQPSTANVWTGSDRHSRTFDTTGGWARVRLQTRVQAVSASVNSPNIYIEYSSDGVNFTKMSDGSAGQIISLTTLGYKQTNWYDLPAAITGVNVGDWYFRVGCIGGDGVADPGLLNTAIQFRK